MEENKKHDMIKMVIGILEKNFKRQSAIKDPTIRYTVFVDKLCLTLDGLMSTLESQQTDLPEDLQKRIQEVNETINKELNNLMEWIQSPSLSPDHDLGNSIMKDAGAHFVKLNTK